GSESATMCSTPLLPRKLKRSVAPSTCTWRRRSVVRPYERFERTYSSLPTRISVLSRSVTTVARTCRRLSGAAPRSCPRRSRRPAFFAVRRCSWIAAMERLPASEFLFRCLADRRNGTKKTQRHSRERMVGVQHRLAAGEVGDGIPARRGAFERVLHLHADPETRAVARRRLDAQQAGVVFAERLLGLELRFDRFAWLPAFERRLERFEQAAVAAVQIGHRLGTGLQQRALRVVHLDLQGNDGVRADRDRLHTRRRFTRS